MGKVAYRQKMLREAEACVVDARAIFHELGDTYMEACCSEHLARVAYAGEDYEKAAALLSNGIVLFGEIGENRAIVDLQKDLERVNVAVKVIQQGVAHGVVDTRVEQDEASREGRQFQRFASSGLAVSSGNA